MVLKVFNDRVSLAVPFVGMTLVLLLVRNTKATDEGLVRGI
jgi:hypothetical protein